MVLPPSHRICMVYLQVFRVLTRLESLKRQQTPIRKKDYREVAIMARQSFRVLKESFTPDQMIRLKIG